MTSNKDKNITVKGAREHNLKNITVSIPRNKLVVVTGVSGSGKSTLAFDTIYAEGQRRYVESLSSYARQFLGRMEKPDVDYIDGLSPAISIDQKGTSHNPRSTVGTVTEIYDYLRLLYARIGVPHCPKCNRKVESQTVQQIVDSIVSLPSESKVQILSPVVRRKKGEHREIIDSARKAGFIRARVNGEIKDLSDDIQLEKQKWHNIEIVVDRLIIKSDMDITRVAESTEAALNHSDGIVIVAIQNYEELLFSEKSACGHCQISLSELEPRTFSYNNPYGACAECTGLGFKKVIDPELVIPDSSISIDNGAIEGWSSAGTLTPWYESQMISLSDLEGFQTDIPVSAMNSAHINLIMNGLPSNRRIPINYRTRRGRKYQGTTKFEGVIKNLQRRHRETDSENVRNSIEKYMTSLPCQVCNGNKLNKEALAVTISKKNITEISNQSIEQSLSWSKSLLKKDVLSPRNKIIASQIVKEIQGRLEFLINVGLDYLSLSRRASTLSGGESQRIRLATQIGSGLMGVLYVCDEPSIGLHPADDDRLISTLKGLRDIGNTVIIVEHDEAIIRASDHIIDMGPGAGEYGGEIIATGNLKKIMSSKDSITGKYISGEKTIPIPKNRRKSNNTFIEITGAAEHNLKDIDVSIPLGILVCITGISGSGKSTLINEILYKKLSQHFNRSKIKPGKFKEIKGLEHIDKIVNINQSPIGRTPRSNPVTYTGTFTYIREVFSKVTEAKSRGYKPGRFSFNVKGGRCEGCSGDGLINIEMQFLPNVTVPCDECKGSRYNREALEIFYKNYNISDVLSKSVTDTIKIFENIPAIRTRLQALEDVGLGYIRIGQPATQLSGGEAQRVKLASELSKRPTGQTLYILDEPTTGLSFEDCAQLLKVLQRLVDNGNTVILIEHHLDLIKSSDWIIDLGPGAGDKGGLVIATGTPEQISKTADSKTGHYLKKILAP